MKIKVFNQAAIKIESTKNIYFDPYQIKEEFHDADYIFITHDHYDHYDEESIKNIMKSVYFLFLLLYNVYVIKNKEGLIICKIK